MELSVVTTLYRSASHLEAFYRRVTEQAQKLTSDYELILVNDGSPDDSLDIAVALHRADDRVLVIDLSRNFGHHRAMMTGLARARGDLVFLLDSDLEEDPEWLPAFHDELVARGADVVYGVQDRRKGGLVERVTGRLFYRLFAWLAPFPLPGDVSTARLMTRRYVRSLVAHRERETMIAALWALTGYDQVPLVVQKRSHGGSTYDLRRKLAITLNAITSFSDRPLVIVFCLGLAIALLAGFAAAYLVVRRLFFGIQLAGWPSLIVSIWLLGGLTLLSLGIVGLYVSRTLVETKRRPYAIVRQVYDASGDHR